MTMYEKLWEMKLVQAEWERKVITTTVFTGKGKYRHKSFNTWYPQMQLLTMYASIPMSQRQHAHGFAK